MRISDWSSDVYSSDLLVALGRQVDVVLGGLLGFLLEGVQHIDRVRELRHIYHPPRAAQADADFADASAHGRHRLEVYRSKAELHPHQFLAQHPAQDRKSTRLNSSH